MILKSKVKSVVKCAEYVNYLIGKPLPLHTKQLNTLAMKYVTKLQTNCQLTFALIETLQLRHYVSFYKVYFIVCKKRDSHFYSLHFNTPGSCGFIKNSLRAKIFL